MEASKPKSGAAFEVYSRPFPHLRQFGLTVLSGFVLLGLVAVGLTLLGALHV